MTSIPGGREQPRPSDAEIESKLTNDARIQAMLADLRVNTPPTIIHLINSLGS
jgi:hypothetical protein